MTRQELAATLDDAVNILQVNQTNVTPDSIKSLETLLPKLEQGAEQIGPLINLTVDEVKAFANVAQAFIEMEKRLVGDGETAGATQRFTDLLQGIRNRPIILGFIANRL